jgi:peroxiredoxin
VAAAVSFSQLLLVLVFAVAGVAKLANRSGTVESIEAFGAPPRSAPAGALLLPIAELAVAAALVPAATALWGALAAAALLVIFSLAVARALRAGSAPDCNCFGGLTQTKVGRGTLVRNLLLAGLAGLVALGSASREPVSAFHWVTAPAAGDRPVIFLMIVCIAGLGWFCWQLLQQNGRLLQRLDAEGLGASPSHPGARTLPPLELGTPAPWFAAADLHGEPVSLESLLAPGLPVALFFTDPGCGACESALEDVARAQRERADELTLAVISSGRIDRIEEKATEFGLNRVVPQDDHALFDTYRVNGFPGIVEIDANGALSRSAALGIDAVREVLGAPVTSPADRIGLVTR